MGTTRPLTARSVIASTLLGMHPPRLSSQLLVRSGELFGISEGTTRTALSRMVRRGELEGDGAAYRLVGPLLARQQRQDASRQAIRGAWDEAWQMAVVVGERRSAAARTELRDAMRRLKLAELREGVWMRPDNLAAVRATVDQSSVEAQCRTFRATPDEPAHVLARVLWDLDAWARDARELTRGLDRYLPKLERGDTSILRDAFVLSAAVLRHLLADPVLPPELLPSDWPGDDLRAGYERYDLAFKTVWRAWFRQQADADADSS